MHDGRAATLDAAILAHGGEAQAARDAFAAMNAVDRAAMIAFLLSMPGLVVAQDWSPYVSRQDGFTINFPGQPRVTETTWQSQLNYTLPARVYSAERGQERYSVTVVDYSSLEQQGTVRLEEL